MFKSGVPSANLMMSPIALSTNVSPHNVSSQPPEEMGLTLNMEGMKELKPSMADLSDKMSFDGPSKYFCVSTSAEVEELIRTHTEDTFSHFVVAKKTKAYGSQSELQFYVK